MARLVCIKGQQIGVSMRALSTSAIRGSQIELSQTQKDKYYPKLGNRDIVGYGHNGNPCYIDSTDFPCPAIRFGTNNEDVKALRVKEQGDWKALSMDDKKALYRASFRMTFAEIEAPTGEWKSIAAGILLAMSVTGWMMIWMKTQVYPELPPTITAEWQEETAKRMIVQRQGPVDGLAAKFDYENNKWK